VNGVRFTVAEEKESDDVDFEKLDFYQLALEFLDELFRLCKTLPRDVRFALGNQLLRAGLSISNVLAEGAGKRSKKLKFQYYSTSIDSARECISMLNVLKRQQCIEDLKYHELRASGRRITGMLHGLMAALDRTPYTVHR
jgi:four helix bundle protein